MDEKTYAGWMAARTKHGGYSGGKENAEHYVWRSMLARCFNENNKDYHHYGAIGVKVCDRWLDYASFLEDMGARPSPKHTLERRDVFGGYSPDNCEWATQAVQQRNKRKTKQYTNGVFTGVLSDCAKLVGISKELAHWRWSSWGTFEKGISWHQLPSR